MRAAWTLALDVPKRLARGRIAWVLVVVNALAILGVAGGVGAGEHGLAFWGAELGLTLANLLGAVFGLALASVLGVVTGLMLLADAATSAFAPGAAECTLPKPVSRATVVIARFLGAVLTAAAFATFVVGGAVLLARLRAGELATSVLWAIPVSVFAFAVLHALGNVSGLAFRNALASALVGPVVWIVSGATKGLSELSMSPAAGLKAIGHAAEIAHRVLPRAWDYPFLAHRLISGATDARSEAELIANGLVWLGLSLGLACLSVRRQDY